MKIQINENNNIRQIEENQKMTIMEFFRKHDIWIDAPCNGKGTCGKCKVRVMNVEEEIGQYEAQLLTKSEAADNMRLACMTRINDQMLIEIDYYEMDTTIQTHYKKAKLDNRTKELAIAIDLGTTTIVAALVDINNETILDTLSYKNPQIKYGADVISRIEAAQKKEKMENKGPYYLLQDAIKSSIQKILDRNKLGEIKHVVLTGNSAMTLFLLGKDVEGLGVYPFKTNLENEKPLIQCDVGLDNIPMYAVKPISGFVGGDSVAGIYYLDMHKSEKNMVILDIGTNSEVMYGNKYKIKCTATAAGPVFEGGHLSNGVGSISGAIYSARYFAGEFYYNTINEEKPIGICGTGVIDIVSECLIHEIIDFQGTFTDEEQEKLQITPSHIKPPIIMTQKDMREVQLAKAAISTALDCMMESTSSHADKIYCAGGMGTNVNIKSAKRIGLLPDKDETTIIFEGNTSLGGAIKIACDIEKANDEIKNIINLSESLVLSELEDFEEKYISHLDYR